MTLMSFQVLSVLVPTRFADYRTAGPLAGRSQPLGEGSVRAVVPLRTQEAKRRKRLDLPRRYRLRATNCLRSADSRRSQTTQTAPETPSSRGTDCPTDIGWRCPRRERCPE